MTEHTRAGIAGRDVESPRRRASATPAPAIGSGGPAGAAALLRLQQAVGNRVVALLVQRKPADINASHTVTFDKDGATGVVSEPRATGLTPSLLINAQIKDGWVLPGGNKVKGGHLLKAEYGGPDNATNVVSWSEKNEDEFGAYENAYAEEAKKNARNGPVTVKLDKAATFADRPDLKLGDDEMDKAGWGSADPERKERQEKYDDVAKNFSTIPTKLSVAISGLTTNPPRFERDGPQVAPAYVKNDAAVKPGFKPYVRFDLTPNLPRVLAKVSDWPAMKKRVKPVVDGGRFASLSHTKGKHGAHFGVDAKTGPAALEAFEVLIENFIKDTSHTQIEGTYKGEDVIHYFDDATKLWVCTHPNNELLAGFRLSLLQEASLKAKGVVK